MAPVPVVTRERFRMSAVPWSAYVAFSDNLGPRHVRITYDQGEMEVMTLSFGHERAKKRLGSVVEVVAEETDTDMEWSGSMTCRREDLARGLEPDECYWIQNELLVRGKSALDLTVDPPPDLALEVEISRSALDRLRVYAALGVPEVWRWDGQTLRVCVLTKRGAYKTSQRSVAFPFLPIAQLAKWLLKNENLSETKWLHAFRKWVREQVAHDWKA